MHWSVQCAAMEFLSKHGPNLRNAKIAEIGALNINGTIRCMMPPEGEYVGFDVAEGKNVDVVLKPGEIPEEHRMKYDVVMSVSSFQFCPEEDIYMKEILDLMNPKSKLGFLFLTMCPVDCHQAHSSSNNGYDWHDTHRWPIETVRKFFSQHFFCQVRQLRWMHKDIVVTGRLKKRPEYLPKGGYEEL